MAITNRYNNVISDFKANYQDSPTSTMTASGGANSDGVNPFANIQTKWSPAEQKKYIDRMSVIADKGYQTAQRNISQNMAARGLSGSGIHNLSNLFAMLGRNAGVTDAVGNAENSQNMNAKNVELAKAQGMAQWQRSQQSRADDYWKQLTALTDRAVNTDFRNYGNAYTASRDLLGDQWQGRVYGDTMAERTRDNAIQDDAISRQIAAEDYMNRLFAEDRKREDLDYEMRMRGLYGPAWRTTVLSNTPALRIA